VNSDFKAYPKDWFGRGFVATRDGGDLGLLRIKSSDGITKAQERIAWIEM
jgi:hypothetical protein